MKTLLVSISLSFFAQTCFSQTAKDQYLNRMSALDIQENSEKKKLSTQFYTPAAPCPTCATSANANCSIPPGMKCVHNQTCDCASCAKLYDEKYHELKKIYQEKRDEYGRNYKAERADEVKRLELAEKKRREERIAADNAPKATAAKQSGVQWWLYWTWTGDFRPSGGGVRTFYGNIVHISVTGCPSPVKFEDFGIGYYSETENKYQKCLKSWWVSKLRNAAGREVDYKEVHIFPFASKALANEHRGNSIDWIKNGTLIDGADRTTVIEVD